MGQNCSNTFSLLILILFLLSALVMAQDEDVIIIESEMVTITISEGMAPTFSWTPGTEIGRLLKHLSISYPLW
jgi:hypothetical protein